MQKACNRSYAAQRPCIFSREKTLFSTNKIEAEANIFAVELLIPDNVLHEYRNMNYSIYDIARIHGVPSELCRLKKLANKGGVENVIMNRKIFQTQNRTYVSKE
ncbi:ImmA/IrrE family metallo-endopeptidase [Bacillus paralicheniformis]